MDKVVLADCDGVLLDWAGTFNRWAKDRGYNKVSSEHYDMHLCYDITKDESRELINTFNESAAICQLEPFRDSKFWVKRIYEEFGFKFRVITSLSTCPYAGKARDMNLRYHFGEAIEEVICLETGSRKLEALRPYEYTGMFWIEDKFENYKDGLDLGLNSILISHDHNITSRSYDDVVVDNWKQIYKIIKKSV